MHETKILNLWVLNCTELHKTFKRLIVNVFKDICGSLSRDGPHQLIKEWHYLRGIKSYSLIRSMSLGESFEIPRTQRQVQCLSLPAA